MSKVLLVAALLAFAGCTPAAEDAGEADAAVPADAAVELAPEAIPADTTASDTSSN